MKRIVLVLGIILGLIVAYLLLFQKPKESKQTKKKIEQQESTEVGNPIKPLVDEDSILEQSEGPLPITKHEQEEKVQGQNVTFKVSGELKPGEIDLRVGSTFKFNDFLCKIDETKLFIQIADKKEQLLEVSRAFMQDCSQQLPNLTTKWESYFSAIDQGSRMPNFPILEEDKSLVIKHSLLNLHNSAVGLEDSIEAYYFLAPFDGEIVEVRKKIGSSVKKGEVVVVIRQEF